MKRLSVLEFKEECKALELKGKCAVLLNGQIKIDKFTTDKGTMPEELYNLKTQNYKNADGLLINFQVSPNFLFLKFEKMMHQLLNQTPDDLDIVITVTYKKISDETANITIISMNKKSCWIGMIEKIVMSFKKCFNL